MSSQHEPMVFDTLEPTVIPVRIADKAYMLREADEAACVMYRNTGARAARFNADGNLSGVDGAANVEPVLVSQCLYEAEAEDANDTSTYRLRTTPDGKADSRFRVSEALVRSWRGSIVSKLFDKAKEISGLDESSEEALTRAIDKLMKQRERLRASKGESPAKNSPDGTTDTSPTA